MGYKISPKIVNKMCSRTYEYLETKYNCKNKRIIKRRLLKKKKKKTLRRINKEIILKELL